jgi:NAD(P)-dependent dehydrogenase (short-subunit alcohol dehydrogenase family)
MDRTRDKICIVTGAAQGIGRGCAERLADEGAKVALFDVLDEEGEALAEALRARGAAARYWHVDVSSEAAVKAAIDEVVAHFGGLHALVNNAGIFGSTKLTHEITEAEWDQVQAVNVKSVLFCTKHAIPHFKAGGGGSIVNLSSIHGLVGFADMPAYNASKGAIRIMSKTDAITYAVDRIRVNSVHPGYIWTPMFDNRLRASGATKLDAARAHVGRMHPLGRMGEVDDIAWGVVYLVSDESKFLTGAELTIDGGYTAR